MANTNLFNTTPGPRIRKPDTRNCEGAPAYSLSPKHALAQYAMTGCLNGTYYASDAAQLETVLELGGGAEPEFIARAAVHAREVGLMKDLPALLCVVLATHESDALERVFPRVIDNGRMLRNFVQMLRSGVAGRKSLGTRPKRLVRRWLESRSDEAIFAASVGTNPSIADIVRMVHPKPATASREALYGYLLGRPYDASALPAIVQELEAFRRNPLGTPPNVPFQLLTSLELGREQWIEIALRAPWHMTRMNLNTFARHGVFKTRRFRRFRNTPVDRIIANRLRDPEAVRKARVFPYQLLAAFKQVSGVPNSVRAGLQDAMELAIENVPTIDGKVVVCPDISGSMQSPVTGYRKGASSAVRCVDVAALMAAAMLRKNPHAEVLPFEEKVVPAVINSRDSVMTNAERLARLGGGGTSCSAPIHELIRRDQSADLLVFVSDNQSWVDTSWSGGTELTKAWRRFKKRNPRARMVCIDIQPHATTQIYDDEDVMNIGGFSDGVFSAIARFAREGMDSGAWVETIEETEL